MTPELLQSICKERQMWTQPHLNTQLFLNYKGFLRIEGMEDYINVRSLHLDNNNIARIEGLDRMTDLRSLHLGGNRIAEIEGLESNIELRFLNLEGNALGHVANVRHMVKLETLNLAANRIEQLEDISELKELPALINMDVSSNSIDAVEGVVEFWSDFQKLKVLRYHGNPGVRMVSHYRKRIVNALPSLTYMDERPIFAVERKSFQAWAEGGLTAMHDAKKEFHRARHEACKVDPERKELVTKRRQMAIERMDREAKEREEKEERERLEVEKQMGVGREAKAVDEGDLEALKNYEKGWRTKVNLYGEDGMRAKVAQEMGGQTQIGQSRFVKEMAATAQREHNADFDFAPPARETGGEAQIINNLLSMSDKKSSPPAPETAVLDKARETALLEPETRRVASVTGGRREERRPPMDVADFRDRSSGQQGDNADRQFAVLDQNAEVCSPNGPLDAPVSATGFNRAIGQGQAAAGDSVMPLIWEQRQAETAAAEAECMERNFAISRAAREEAPANQLEGLD